MSHVITYTNPFTFPAMVSVENVPDYLKSKINIESVNRQFSDYWCTFENTISNDKSSSSFKYQLCDFNDKLFNLVNMLQREPKLFYKHWNCIGLLLKNMSRFLNCHRYNNQSYQDRLENLVGNFSLEFVQLGPQPVSSEDPKKKCIADLYTKLGQTGDLNVLLLIQHLEKSL